MCQLNRADCKLGVLRRHQVLVRLQSKGILKEALMYFVGLGILLLLLKYLKVEPVAAWTWWWVLSPFAAAVVWWWWADATGYTKRRAMDKMDQRKSDRIEKHRDALGWGARKSQRRK